jgi:dTDP-4-amino-4,6-dideoxygalactose transaminase
MTVEGVPFFRPDISEMEIAEVVAALRSGWLTTGPWVKRFEEEFSAAVGSPHAVAVNSCTAALHLAVQALGLKSGETGAYDDLCRYGGGLRYLGGFPIVVDCDPLTLNVDLNDNRHRLAA